MTPPAPASSFARGALSALALLAITSAQSLQCGNELCFAGPINDGVVLQRAPAHAAVLGSVPPASPANAPLTLTFSGADGAGAAYNKSFAFAAMADFTWKLVLPDAFEAGGNFTVQVTCLSCAGGVTSISRTNVTFGDVWVCSGQSNMQLGMWSSFLQDEIDARVLQGEFESIRMWGMDNGGTNVSGNWIQPAAQAGWCRNQSWVAREGEDMGAKWCTPLDLMTPRPGGDGQTWFWQTSQTCFYFAVFLRDFHIAAGVPAPPIGLMINPVGGTMIESWVSVEAQGTACVNSTCLCAGLFNGKCDPYQRILMPDGTANPNCTTQDGACCATVGGQGGLWNAMQQPIVNTTIKGLLYYQVRARARLPLPCPLARAHMHMNANRNAAASPTIGRE